MTRHRLFRAVTVMLALSTTLVVPRSVRASDSAAAVRDRISAGIAAGMVKNAAPIAPAPRAAASHPLALPSASAAGANGGTPAPTAAAPDTTPDGAWNELLAGNSRFVACKPRPRPLLRERDDLALAQHPRAVVLGCADSRVSPELVFDQSLGDVFVVRTAGNIVDPIALGSIEYAVEHLHARLLVVLGHGDCGAVKAAASGDPMPSTHLQAIVDRIRPTVQRLSNCFEGDELIQRSVIENARQSATDILANSELLRTALGHGQLKVLSAVYDMRTGVVASVSVPSATAQAQAPAR